MNELVKQNNFDLLWQVWPNTKNKKGSEKSFNTLLRKNKKLDPGIITSQLIEDVQLRLQYNQFGFTGLMLSTYINNERWNDGHNEDAPVRKDPLLESMGL